MIAQMRYEQAAPMDATPLLDDAAQELVAQRMADIGMQSHTYASPENIMDILGIDGDRTAHWITTRKLCATVATMLGVHESYEADMYSRAPPDQHEQMEASQLIAYNASQWREIMQILRRGEEIKEVAVQHHIVVCKMECRSLCRWIKFAQAVL